MKCVLSLALLGLLASAVIGQAPNVKKHQKNVQFIPGQTYIYEYNSRLLSGIPQLADQYAGFEIQADLVLQPLNEEVVAMKLANIKVGRINNDVPVNQQEDIDLAHQPHTEYQRELTKPIRFFQTEGKIKAFEADASEPQWSLNMKKSILSLLNVNLNPRKIIKAPAGSQLAANLIPRQNQQADELRVYPVYEEGRTGVSITVRGPAMIPAENMAVDVPAISLNGSAPRCEHLDGLAPVTPQSDHCLDCQDLTDRPASLAVCLSCGWVACSDDSPSRHARAHYEETDHPLAVGLEPVSRWRWCYVHQRFV